jgi:hypothetical protein
MRQPSAHRRCVAIAAVVAWLAVGAGGNAVGQDAATLRPAAVATAGPTPSSSRCRCTSPTPLRATPSPRCRSSVGDGLAKTWPRWFAGASGLVMTRTLPAGTATMQPLGGVQLATSDAGANWPGGVDLHMSAAGSACGSSTRSSSSTGACIGVGTSAGVVVEPRRHRRHPAGAGRDGGWPARMRPSSPTLDAQQISRSDVINDVEINWVYSLWDRPEFLPRERAVNLMWLAGFRFFQVGDNLTLQNTAPSNPALGGLDFNAATNNNIYGAQVGAKFDWRFLARGAAERRSQDHDRRQLDHQHQFSLDAGTSGAYRHVHVRRLPHHGPLHARRVLVARIGRHGDRLGRHRPLDALARLPGGGRGQHRPGRRPVADHDHHARVALGDLGRVEHDHPRWIRRLRGAILTT